MKWKTAVLPGFFPVMNEVNAGAVTGGTVEAISPQLPSRMRRAKVGSSPCSTHGLIRSKVAPSSAMTRTLDIGLPLLMPAIPARRVRVMPANLDERAPVHVLRDGHLQEGENRRRHVHDPRFAQVRAGRGTRPLDHQHAVVPVAPRPAHHILGDARLPPVQALNGLLSLGGITGPAQVRVAPVQPPPDHEIGRLLYPGPVVDLLPPPRMFHHGVPGLGIAPAPERFDERVPERLVLGSGLDDAVGLAALEVDPDPGVEGALLRVRTGLLPVDVGEPQHRLEPGSQPVGAVAQVLANRRREQAPRPYLGPAEPLRRERVQAPSETVEPSQGTRPAEPQEPLLGQPRVDVDDLVRGPSRSEIG